MLVSNVVESETESDVNFSDVFGGPPRRSSMYTMRQRYSYADADAEEEDLTTRVSPVFGANRRRKANDFFNDIFKGYESQRMQQDPSSSRISLSHTSLPAAAKVMDLPTFGPPTRSSTSHVPSYSYSPSPLSRSNQEPKNGVPSESLSIVDSEGKSSIIRTEVASGFHFSIYKWASKGVPLMTVKPARSKKAPVDKIGASETVKKCQEKPNSLMGTVVDTAGQPRKSGDFKGEGKVKEASLDLDTDGNGMDHKLQFNLNKEKSLKPQSMTEVEECLKQSDKCYPSAKTKNYITSSTSSNPKNGTDVSKTVVGDRDESSQRNFVMKEISLEKNEKAQPGKDYDDMQAVDAKISKWSNGKEGNIRSLLSTLQYVLWPESGWKPVPLVDIVEGNAVKRAYQRALLRLHPDKLQQKGAASHQKYIAQKVFDILQEAWTQFNSL